MANMLVTSVSAAKRRNDQDRRSVLNQDQPGLFASMLQDFSRQNNSEPQEQYREPTKHPIVGQILRLVKNPGRIMTDEEPFSFSVLA
jgi:hypothetical protein